MEEMIPSRLYDISEWRQRWHSMAMWRPLYALSSICWDPFGSSVCVCGWVMRLIVKCRIACVFLRTDWLDDMEWRNWGMDIINTRRIKLSDNCRSCVTKIWKMFNKFKILIMQNNFLFHYLNRLHFINWYGYGYIVLQDGLVCSPLLFFISIKDNSLALFWLWCDTLGNASHMNAIYLL